MSEIILSPSMRLLQRGTVPALLILLAALIALPLIANETLLTHSVQTLVFILFAMSLNLLVGTGGMLSMGHAAMFASAGYTAGALTKFHGVSMAVALPAGVVVAGIVALFIGYFSIRREHAYFIMLTLAFGQLVYVMLWKWVEVTGGDEGMIGFGPSPLLRSTSAYYFFTLAIVVASIAVLHRLTRSPFGQTLAAIRDNPQRAAFAGINTRAIQLAAFVIAGLFAGLAGTLEAFFQRGMFIDQANFMTSSDVLVACVLGGTGAFFGPVFGALLFRGVSVIVPALTQYWVFVLGVIILVVALRLPNGIASLFKSRELRP